MTAFLIIAAFILIALLVAKKKKERKNKKKGKLGEAITKRQLKMLSKKYTVLNDILLKTDRGTTQIDHIVISEYGIFPIETKNYWGIVRGEEKEKDWSVETPHKTYTFHNPVKQNYSHVYALMNTLEINNFKMFNPIVVFSDRAYLEVNSRIPVIHIKNLCAAIEDNYKEKKLSKEDIKMYTKILKRENITSGYAKRKHVRYVKKISAIS